MKWGKTNADSEAEEEEKDDEKKEMNANEEGEKSPKVKLLPARILVGHLHHHLWC